ncbi:hypothetical protein JYK14_23550 [Siccirubricoccus sp. KC 17139]|uniref:DUF393 domain-containing protein n=1 Tax=Siccirubricoccus soli TaxID=2899147 RepID=A0ABT1DAZ0_9PROT|nr:hypothetical protein [Siccirubricoccus soli]MCO6419112.1 hypothetical protein [Siccirubricoccus soli]MCP2685247.1 hypothetical protein [Siccirubricoccus soli]
MTRPRPAHARAAAVAGQRVYIAFGGAAELPWLRLLRPGFRHCFAALEEAGSWLVADPLSGRLVLTRLDLPPGFDLPGFYRRAGLTVLGPFRPGGARWSVLPSLWPLNCVSLCRAVLGSAAPFALTPHGLYRGLRRGGSGPVGPAGALPLHPAGARTWPRTPV